MNVTIRQGKKLSTKRAKELILAMVRLGNNYDYPLHTTLDVKKFFASKGMKFEDVVEHVRTFTNRVPYFENLIGSTWTVLGGSVSMGGETVVDGDGQFATATYWAHFEQMGKQLQAAAANVSMNELHSAVERGVASIEAYIAHRVSIWNSTNPEALLHDNKENKVPFDDKITAWIPRMTGGYQLDRGTRHWNDFVKLRKVRDTVAVHPRGSSHGINFKTFVDLTNLTRTGIGGLLIDLHVLFGEKVPSGIIRHAHAPDYFIDR